MKVKAKMKVTSKEFFDFIISQVKKDYLDSTKKEEDTFLIKKGFSYKKDTGGEEKAKITISKYLEPKEYASEYQIGGNIYDMGYDIIDKGDSIEILYSELKRGDTSSSKINQFVMQRRFDKQMKNVEKMLLAARKNESK